MITWIVTAAVVLLPLYLYLCVYGMTSAYVQAMWDMNKKANRESERFAAAALKAYQQTRQ